MDNRRDFIKKATIIATGTGVACALLLSIQKALAINPELNSTYLDAEHVVIFMQENRSFDHCFGSLQGVRGLCGDHDCLGAACLAEREAGAGGGLMDWAAADSILKEIRAECGKDPRLLDAREMMLRRAFQYARIRTDWGLSTLEDRQRMNAERTDAHNVLIDACNILSRAMAEEGRNNSWRERLSDDRQVIGDFACLAHAIYGIAAR